MQERFSDGSYDFLGVILTDGYESETAVYALQEYSSQLDLEAIGEGPPDVRAQMADQVRILTTGIQGGQTRLDTIDAGYLNQALNFLIGIFDGAYANGEPRAHYAEMMQGRDEILFLGHVATARAMLHPPDGPDLLIEEL